MTVADILKQSALSGLDTEVMLADVLGNGREWLLTHPEYVLNEEQLHMWSNYETRRKNHEPVAYIVGHKEFYGRDFLVDPRVLIPRPATEGLIDAVKIFLTTGKNSCTDTDTDIVAGCKALGDVSAAAVLLDIGTGSGCIAITLKLELPTYDVCASDISTDALAVAKHNATQLQADIAFAQANGPEVCSAIKKPFVVVSNPPYVPEGDNLLPNVVDFEPHEALFSGPNGTDLLQKIATEAADNPLCVGICLECRKNQWEELENML